MMRMNSHPNDIGWLHTEEIAGIRASIQEHARRHGLRAQDADELIAAVLAQFNVSPEGRHIPYQTLHHPRRRFHRGRRLIPSDELR